MKLSKSQQETLLAMSRGAHLVYMRDMGSFGGDYYFWTGGSGRIRPKRAPNRRGLEKLVKLGLISSKRKNKYNSDHELHITEAGREFLMQPAAIFKATTVDGEVER